MTSMSPSSSSSSSNALTPATSTDSLAVVTEDKQQRDISITSKQDLEDVCSSNGDGATTAAVTSLPRSTSSHKQIQPPRYVRSNTLGLQRANTVCSPTKCSSSSSSPIKIIRTRRISVGFPEELQYPLDRRPPLPSPRRSDSAIDSSSKDKAASATHGQTQVGDALHDRKLHSLLYEYGDTNDVADLPSDPKTWTPSQLSIYLSHMLRLTPKPVIADVMKFIVQRGLTGKRFLRMRNQDLIEMGININWCRVLSTARERLRRECLRGRIFGFIVSTTDDTQGEGTSQTNNKEAPEPEEEDIESLFLKLPSSTSTSSLNQEWNKNSWRRKEGTKSKGRVKGIASAFERPETDEMGKYRSSTSLRRDSTISELDEVVRIRRNRQVSTDSMYSNLSSTGGASGSMGEFLSSPSRSAFGDGDGEEGRAERTYRLQRLRAGISSESESETEEGHYTRSNEKVDWSFVEPLAPEETSFLPDNFLAQLEVPSSNTSSPSTPLASTFAIPTPAHHSEVFDVDAGDVHENQALPGPPDDLETASTRTRKQSDLSEVTSELSEEHLAYWNKMTAGGEDDASVKNALARSAPHLLVGDDELHQEDLSMEHLLREEDTKHDTNAMLFAENDGNITTMKRQPLSAAAGSAATSLSKASRTAKRTQSVEDFGSLRLQTVRSRASSGQGSTRTYLRELFANDPDQPLSEHEVKDTSKAKRKEKNRRAVEDYLKNQDKDDKYYSFKSRSGSIVVLPKAEVEEMQARLKDLEEQLELAKSASTYHISHQARSDLDSPAGGMRTRTQPTSEAMSAWVKGALGEASDVARGNNTTGEQSWLGLGGWALAAGLGIGIVVGEAMFTKLRR